MTHSVKELGSQSFEYITKPPIMATSSQNILSIMAAATCAKAEETLSELQIQSISISAIRDLFDINIKTPNVIIDLAIARLGDTWVAEDCLPDFVDDGLPDDPELAPVFDAICQILTSHDQEAKHLLRTLGASKSSIHLAPNARWDETARRAVLKSLKHTG